ncbi:protein kinase domain-containing protein [Sphaerisporangium aureirubrum]|uniref:Protein kinase domain-containing protein n=1 Tax=Sphaerisporangium aureirubrum TaxID=1544736 RepID=A0ABW1NAY3_9ACTN
MARIPAREFEQLLLTVIRGPSAADTVDQLLNSDEGSRTRGTIYFLRNILEHISDHELHQGHSSFADACDRAMRDLHASPDPRGSGIAGFLALICMNVKLLERRFESPDRTQQAQADAYFRELFRLTSIRSAIYAVYHPGAGVERAFERSVWNEIDPASLEYHKAGTTSFILAGVNRRPADESGAYRKLAVKCVLFPWNKLTAIAQATDDYAVDYGAANTPPVVVHPIASSDRWVLMPFQEGRTLTEYLEELETRTPPVSMTDRLTTCRDLAARLTQALHQLADRDFVDPARAATQHLDLAPSNILLAAHSGDIKLIDLGPNHLYSRQIGIAEHDDSVYVAPEVKNRGSSASSDAYSLGIILIQVMCGYAPRDGRAPDTLWQLSPDLGRALEDLIEEDPHKRLLLLQDPAVTFQTLGKFLDHVIELAQQEPDASGSETKRLLSRLLPSSIEVWTQFQQWQLSRHSKQFRTADRYLLFFSFLATACWWLILAKTALFEVDDLVTGQLQDLPEGINLVAQIAALVQGLIGAKFYQTIIARLTARNIPGPLARLTEISLRLMSCVALLSVFIPMFWLHELWAWGGAAGAFLVSICNGLTSLLTTRMYQAGADANLSTVPPPGKVRARGYEQWWWTMLCYAIAIAGVALGLQTGMLHDTWVYLTGFVGISIGVHYISKFVVAGYGVRAELARAFSAGERVAILTTRGDLGDIRWPPRFK